MSADVVTVAAGAPYNDDSGTNSSHMRAFACSYTTNTWNLLDNTLVGAKYYDNFG